MPIFLLQTENHLPQRAGKALLLFILAVAHSGLLIFWPSHGNRIESSSTIFLIHIPKPTTPPPLPAPQPRTEPLPRHRTPSPKPSLEQPLAKLAAPQPTDIIPSPASPEPPTLLERAQTQALQINAQLRADQAPRNGLTLRPSQDQLPNGLRNPPKEVKTAMQASFDKLLEEFVVYRTEQTQEGRFIITRYYTNKGVFCGKQLISAKLRAVGDAVVGTFGSCGP